MYLAKLVSQGNTHPRDPQRRPETEKPQEILPGLASVEEFLFNANSLLFLDNACSSTHHTFWASRVAGSAFDGEPPKYD